MSSPPPLHQVPSTLGRGKVWATNCADCGAEVRMGPGAKAAMVRLIEAVGQYCDDCRSKPDQPTAT